MLTVNLGFYQVGERLKNQFGNAVKKLLTEINFNIDQDSEQINFKSYQKNTLNRIF